MKFLKSIVVCLCLLSVFIICENEFQTCAKCAVPNFEVAKTRAAAIFVGKVSNVTETGSTKIFEFQVSKSWKGTTLKKVKVIYQESARFEPIYEVGKEYLMFAESGDDGKLQVYRCSLSKGIEDSVDELKLLGKARKVKKAKSKA